MALPSTAIIGIGRRPAEADAGPRFDVDAYTVDAYTDVTTSDLTTSDLTTSAPATFGSTIRERATSDLATSDLTDEADALVRRRRDERPRYPSHALHGRR